MPAPNPRPRGNPNWVKGGPSPNPSGRPKGLGDVIRSKLGEGEKLVDWAIEIATSKGARDAERLTAIRWLSENGYGKPVERLEHSGPDGKPIATETHAVTPPDFSKLTREELDQYADLLAKVVGGAEATPPSGEGGASPALPA